MNSKVFHRAINRRRMRNGITGLEVEGEWVEEPERIKRAVKEFFRNHFQRRGGDRMIMSHDLIEQRLSEAEREFLVREFRGRN